jgi:TonB family protein
VLFHLALIGVGFVAARSTPSNDPPVYKISLVAAPQGVPQVGVIQPPPKAPPRTEAPRASETPRQNTKTVQTKVRPQETPKAATANTPTPTEVSKAPAPTAGSFGGGRGTDVDDVETPGLVFPWSGYLHGIVNAIRQRFPSQSGVLRAKVLFTIQRDGSVRADDIRVLESSRNPAFDEEAIGAIESASRQKAFGQLPKEYPDDVLVVTFRFEPPRR